MDDSWHRHLMKYCFKLCIVQHSWKKEFLLFQNINNLLSLLMPLQSSIGYSITKQPAIRQSKLIYKAPSEFFQYWMQPRLQVIQWIIKRKKLFPVILAILFIIKIRRNLKKSKNSKKTDKLRGLPNLSLTCYLNSCLQLLFSCQKLTFHLGASSIPSCSPFKALLSRIFTIMKKQQQSYKMRDQLKQLAQQLQIDKSIQNDALEYLLMIIEKLQGQWPQICTFFQFQYETSCGCKNSNLRFKEMTMSFQPQTCVKCNQLLNVIYKRLSPYLILMAKLQFGKIKDIFDCIQVEKEPICRKYELKAAILYFGNGSCGHYVCLRVLNGKKYIYDDQKVQQYDPQKYGNWKALILLYQQGKDYLKLVMDND